MFLIGGAAGPVLAGRRVELRPPALSDYAEWSALREASRDFLRPWEPIWPADELTRAAFRRRLRRYAQEMREETGCAFLVHRREEGRSQLVGGLSLSNIRRGVTQSCALGYWMGRPFAGQGLMTEAVRAVVPFVFGTLRLHRIEAACLPHNAASTRLLEKVGFQREGYARRYLCIAGAWQDHVLYALVAEDMAVDERPPARQPDWALVPPFPGLPR